MYTYNFTVNFKFFIIEHLITVKRHTMLLNGIMLKGLNEQQTICQIVKKLLLMGGKVIFDGL